jgi:TPP-dependent 2-oxoacid decarboxylase
LCRALAEGIAAEGVNHIFAVMGDANPDIIVELCEEDGLKYVHAHHETAAVGMADGYSRFTGKIGLAATTQGPGYTNATTSHIVGNPGASHLNVSVPTTAKPSCHVPRVASAPLRGHAL